jgi:16S rRNA (uracil1498-N3)-methyltransferase
LIRVFVDAGALAGERVSVTGADARHLAGVLRVRPGETIVAVTPDGMEHRATVLSASGAEVQAKVVDSALTATEPSLNVRIAAALLKGDQLERMLEYCSEFGAGEFQPILAERAIARLDPEKLEQRSERWRAIVRSAAALGQRGRVPRVLSAEPLVAAARRASEERLQSYLLYEGTGLESLSTVAFDPARGAVLVVGPEGGWSDTEVSASTAAGAVAVTLGPRIMRPLPAALAALSVLFHRAGQLRRGGDPR